MIHRTTECGWFCQRAPPQRTHACVRTFPPVRNIELLRSKINHGSFFPVTMSGSRTWPCTRAILSSTAIRGLAACHNRGARPQSAQALWP